MQRSRVHEGDRATFFFPEPHARAVHVTGSFCDWRVPGIPMTAIDGGWTASVDGIGPADLEYKFVVDGRWLPDPVNLVAAPDGQGGHNSLLPKASPRGSTYHLGFRSPALSETRRYTIYLPPSHDRTEKRFPVLYLLHGALDWERTWLESGHLAQVTDDLIRRGELGELIVVMPFDNGDLYRGDRRALDYLARDVVGHIDYEFQTFPAAAARALDGLSTGGFTSLVVGAERPDVYRSIGSMSGSYDDRAFEAVETHAPAVRDAGQRHLLSCGLDEPHYASCRAMFDKLEALGVTAQWLDLPGGHEWGVWSALLSRHLRFHDQTIRA